MAYFVFDLDGTLTKRETLPLIAAHFNERAPVELLTGLTLRGVLPFAESLAERVKILGKYPVEEVRAVLGTVELHGGLLRFIQENRERCLVATGNLGCWTESLAARIACPCRCSEGVVERGRVTGLAKVLDKEGVVMNLQGQGHKVVFIGEAYNDIEAMRRADVAIASGLTHEPVAEVLDAADYYMTAEDEFCELLNRLRDEGETE